MLKFVTSRMQNGKGDQSPPHSTGAKNVITSCMLLLFRFQNNCTVYLLL